MGVLNVTPDSFSDGGLFFDPGAALAQARRMIEEGVDIIDIGAEVRGPTAAPSRSTPRNSGGSSRSSRP